MKKLVRIEDLPKLRQLLQPGFVVWTNGVFDMLHVGHLRSLQTARNLGTALVVGVNSDESTAAIKPGRPVIPECQRAELVAALSCVDYVVLFSGDPLACITALRPDVLAKGEEYRDRPVIGQEFVESYNGRVHFLPMVEGVSTSAIIKRIKDGLD